MDMVIFRENSEDVYAGIEWEAGTEGADQVIAFLQASMGVNKIDSLKRATSASSRSAVREPNASFSRHSTMHSSTAPRASRWCTRGTS